MGLDAESAFAVISQGPLWFWAVIGLIVILVVMVWRWGVEVKKQVVDVKTTNSPSAAQFAGRKMSLTLPDEQVQQPEPEKPYVNDLLYVPSPDAVPEPPKPIMINSYPQAEPPRVERPKLNGQDRSIDGRMENLVKDALAEFSETATLEGFVIKSKVGKFVIRRPKEEEPATIPQMKPEPVKQSVAETVVSLADGGEVEIPDSNKEDES